MHVAVCTHMYCEKLDVAMLCSVHLMRTLAAACTGMLFSVNVVGPCPGPAAAAAPGSQASASGPPGGSNPSSVYHRDAACAVLINEASHPSHAVFHQLHGSTSQI